MFILLVSFSFKQNTCFHRNKTSKFCRFSAKVNWITSYLWKKNPKHFSFTFHLKTHAVRIHINFNKIRLSFTWLKVYYRWNLILQYYALHFHLKIAAILLIYHGQQPGKINLSEANQDEDIHDDSWQFHHKPRSLPSKCPPILLVKHKHSLTWAKTSLSHVNMVPIPLSPKYCPIYMCSLDFLVCPILDQANIISSSLSWYILSPFCTNPGAPKWKSELCILSTDISNWHQYSAVLRMTSCKISLGQNLFLTCL